MRGAPGCNRPIASKACDGFGHFIEHLLASVAVMVEKGKGLSNGNWISSEREDGKRTWARVVQGGSR